MQKLKNLNYPIQKKRCLGFKALSPSVRLAVKANQINKRSFVPTPDSIADIMIREAKIKPDHRILEPEAGQGHLIDKIAQSLPFIKIDALENHPILANIVKTKSNVNFLGNDIMSFNPGKVYDRIIMNPPFNAGNAIKHVVHCFNLLKSGGILVSVVPEYVFNAPNNLLELITNSKNLTNVIKLSKEAFMASDVPAKVNTSIVVLKKHL